MVVYAGNGASIAGLSRREVGDNVSDLCQSIAIGAVGVLLHWAITAAKREPQQAPGQYTREKYYDFDECASY